MQSKARNDLKNLYVAYQHQSNLFEGEKIGTYRLRAFPAEDFFLYVLRSPEGKIVALKEFRTKAKVAATRLMELALEEEKLLQGDFAQVKVIAPASGFINLIPKPFFSQKQLEKIAEMSMGSSVEGVVLRHEELQIDEAVAVYTIPAAIQKRCMQAWSTVEYCSCSSLAIRMSRQLAQNRARVLTVHIFAAEAIFTAFSNGRLLFCNTFSYNSIEDLAYYIHLIVDTLQWEPGTYQQFLTGEFELDSPLISKLKKLAPSFKVPVEKLKEKFSVQSDKFPSWRYAYLAY